MKKFALILIFILCFTGCSQTVTEEANDPIEYLERPTITFTTGYAYNDQNVLVGKAVEITEDSFEAVGRNAFLEIAFHSSIDVGAITELIQLDGHDDYTVTGHRAKRNTIKLMARDVEYGKSYRLLISSEIKNLAGLSLSEDIAVDIVMNQMPMVFYQHENSSGEEVTLGESSSNPKSIHFTQPLTEDQAKFTLAFNTSIDKESVEEAINNCFGDRELLQFNWITNQQLELIIGNLKSNYEYRIVMNEETSDALVLIGTLFFEFQEPIKLMSYDLTTGQSEVLKTFDDKPAMVIPSDQFEQNFIVDDYFNRYVLNPTEGVYKIITDAKYAFGSRVYGWYSIWLDGETVLKYDETANSLAGYNVVTGESMPLFSLPDAFASQGPSEVILSPDKDKIALTSDWATTGLYVYTFDGILLYENTTIGGWDIRNDGSASLGIQWLNNQAILFTDSPKDMVNVLSTEDWIVEIVVENASYDAIHPEGSLILVNSRIGDIPGTRLYNIETETQEAIEEWCSEPVFVNGDWLAYNMTGDFNQRQIILYDINTKEKQYIGDGKIIGKSADGSKIYFIKNYQDVYDMYRPS